MEFAPRIPPRKKHRIGHIVLTEFATRTQSVYDIGDSSFVSACVEIMLTTHNTTFKGVVECGLSATPGDTVGNPAIDTTPISSAIAVGQHCIVRTPCKKKCIWYTKVARTVPGVIYGVHIAEEIVEMGFFAEATFDKLSELTDRITSDSKEILALQTSLRSARTEISIASLHLTSAREKITDQERLLRDYRDDLARMREEISEYKAPRAPAHPVAAPTPSPSSRQTIDFSAITAFDRSSLKHTGRI